jgi:hypothetical protein
MPKTQKLVSKRNTKRVRDLVIYAGEKRFGKALYEIAFRGGRWTVLIRMQVPEVDYVYEAYDCEPGLAGTGLDFRKVT